MPSRGRHPGNALLALFVASALFAAAGFVQSNAFVATGNRQTRVSLAAPGALAAPLQAATNPLEHPVTASRLRSLGCLLLAMGAFAARSGARPTNGFRLAGPKLLVQFHPRASESKLATAALGTAYSMELGNEWNVDSAGADLNLASELIDIAPTASPKPMVAAFGQTAQRLPGLGALKSSKGRRAHQRRQHRNIGSKLCASLRYEMPSLSFDSSRVRSKIQMGLSIGASPKIPKSRNAARSNESIESDQVMAELLFRSYSGEDHEKKTAIPFEDQWSLTSLVRDTRMLKEAL